MLVLWACMPFKSHILLHCDSHQTDTQIFNSWSPIGQLKWLELLAYGCFQGMEEKGWSKRYHRERDKVKFSDQLFDPGLIKLMEDHRFGDIIAEFANNSCIYWNLANRNCRWLRSIVPDCVRLFIKHQKNGFMCCILQSSAIWPSM